MSNKTEATFHGASLGSMQGTPPAWDRLDDFSDTTLSKSDVRTALEVLGGVFDEAALRTLTTKQLTCLTTASHARPEGRHRAEADALDAYQKARRTLAAEPKPRPIEELDPEGPEYAAIMHRANIETGIFSLVTISGENSRDHGFHEDWPVIESELDKVPGHARQLGLAIVEKIALQHEELSESLGEIRSGRDPLEIYFVDKNGVLGEKGAEYEEQHYGNDGVTPLLKPEGFLVEQADAIIRIADLAYLVNGRAELIEALAIKHEYNATRPFKHGRKF